MRKHWIFSIVVSILGALLAPVVVLAEKDVYISKNLAVSDSRFGAVGCLSLSSYVYVADSWDRQNSVSTVSSGGWASFFAYDRCSGYILLDVGTNLYLSESDLIIDKKLRTAMLKFSAPVYDYYQGIWLTLEINVSWAADGEENSKGRSNWVTRKPTEVLKSTFQGQSKSAQSSGSIVLNGINFGAADADEDAFIYKGNNRLIVIRND